VALPPFDVALEDFALEEDFFVEELDFALDEDFALLLLDFFTALLDTSSSESALLPLSPPQAVNTDIAVTSINGTNFANIFIKISSPYI
jgi:hypothetical protein